MIGNPLLLGDEGYQIQRSLRFRSSANASLTRTPASAGNRALWTWSGWVKRGVLGTFQTLFGTQLDGSNIGYISFDTNNKLDLNNKLTDTTGVEGNSTRVFRDPAAWYHLVIVFDGNQASQSNRFVIYVNGVQDTFVPRGSKTAGNGYLNSAVSHAVGNLGIQNNSPLDGYMTEINFIDGQALTPSSFGETNAVTGVWQPKKYAGTYGTNGFYLNFSDNSNNTAATIGKDYSGNGNNWTPNNISVTAGVTYDSMLDVPLGAGGGERGNYAVVNPLSKGTSQTNVIDGNLYAIPISGGSNWGTVFSSIAIPTSGKWYMEATAQVYAGSGNSSSFGVVDSTSFIPTNSAILYTFTTGEGFDGILAHLFSDYVSPISDGVQGTNVTGLTGTSINLMLALDVDNGKVYAGYNGTWLNSGNPVGGTGEVASRTFSANDVVAGHTSWNGTNDQSQYYNFGQRPFAYTPPTGFKALHTGNLPEPVITQGGKYMAATTYSGTSATQNVINSGAMQPDLVWIKARSSADNHALFDAVRGVNKRLISNLSNAEDTLTDTLMSFNSNGFTLGADAGGRVNASGYTYVGWQWKANGAAVSNTAGSITSQVSAGVSQGFSVVTYTGTQTAATVGHGLGVAPKMIIVKARSNGTFNWTTWHGTFTGNGYIYIDGTNAVGSSSGPWNGTLPTSSVFSLGADLGTNRSGDTYVAYCFSEVAGYSKFGSYTGNGSADGPFVYLGFRPRFVMVKRTDTTGNWEMHDTSRATYNADAPRLWANLSSAEDATEARIDELSNGFKLRSGAGDINVSGGTYIFAAFAEAPFKNSLAR